MGRLCMLLHTICNHFSLTFGCGSNIGQKTTISMMNNMTLILYTTQSNASKMLVRKISNIFYEERKSHTHKLIQQ